MPVQRKSVTTHTHTQRETIVHAWRASSMCILLCSISLSYRYQYNNHTFSILILNKPIVETKQYIFEVKKKGRFRILLF
jgi:hypothetical protein